MTTGWLQRHPRVPINAANYAVGRQGYRDIWFCLHCTDDDYADNYPANLGRYWAHNGVKVGVHFAVSDTQTYQYVSMDDTAFQARNPGNLRAVGVELSGRASWSRSQWLAHKPMLRRAAALCAEVSAVRGYRTTLGRLTTTELRARKSGLTCHADLSAAFDGTHTDPGAPGFPWDFFATELRQVVKPRTAKPAAAREGMMAVTDQQFKAVAEQVARITDLIAGDGAHYPDSNLAKQLGYVVKRIGELEAKVDALAARR